MDDNDGFILVSGKKLPKKQSNYQQTHQCRRSPIFEERTLSPAKDDINTNKKSILCKNMIQTGKCPYGNLCNFAHNLEEQRVNPERKRIYGLIKNNASLHNLNLVNRQIDFKVFANLTQACPDCVEKKCLGGYNCKRGAFSEEYVICYDDFYYGNCKKMQCSKKHLTLREFVPYYIQVEREYGTKYRNISEIPPQKHENDITEQDSDISLDDKSDEMSDDEYILILHP